MAKSKSFKATKFNDWLYGTVGNNKISGKGGDDELFGLQGNDRLSGDDGDDNLYGDFGNDKLNGGDGKDTIYGGLGTDQLSGGKGHDLLYGNSTSYSDDEKADGADRLAGGEGHDSIYGGYGNDKLSGDAGDDRLGGQEGNDKLTGGKGDDFLHGDEGMDKLSGGDGDDYLHAGYDKDKDVLNAGAGNDWVVMSEQDMALGGKGVDTLTIDLYSYSTTSSPVTTPVILNLSKISGKKATSLGSHNMKAGQFEKAVIDVSTNVAGTLVTGSKGDDRIDVFGTTGTVSGGKGNDRISVYGRDGGFTVDGGKGNDRITFWGSDNKVTGGAGNDIFTLQDSGLNNAIFDFTASDRLLVSRNSWYDFNNMDKANFLVSGSDPVANSALGQFLYDTDDGRLLYDEDGTGAKMASVIVTLANKAALTTSSFILDF